LSFAPVNQWSGTFTLPSGFGFSQPFGAHVQVSIANSDGNWLFALITWQSGDPEPSTIAVGDDAGNNWQPLGAPVGTSSAAGDVRAVIWAAADAAPASTVWASPSGWAPCYAVTILEVPGLGPGLSVQAIGTAYANAGTSLASALPAPASASFALALGGMDQPGAFSSGPGAGWTSLPPVIAGGSPLVGAYVDGSALGTSGWTAGLAEWEAITGIPLAVTRWYAGTTYTVGTSLTQMAAAGTRILLDLAPPYSPVSGTDLASIGTLLDSLKALGADVRVSLWHEPALSGLTAAQYTAVVQYYGPAVRARYPLWCVFSGTDTTESNGYFPGTAWVDGIAADCYATSTTNLDNCATMADAHGLPLGLWEFNSSWDLGISPSPVTGVTQAQGITFFSYVQSLFAARLTAGKPNGDICLFSGGGIGSTGTANFLGDYLSQAAGFEGGIAHWVNTGNCSIAASGTWAHSGAQSLRLTATAAGNMSARPESIAGSTAYALAVTPGQQVSASSWWRAGSTPRNVHTDVTWYSAALANLSTSNGTAVADSTSADTFTSCTVTAPASAAWAVAHVQVDSAGAGGEVHYVDDVQVCVLPASTDHTAPVQFPWDWRIASLQSMQQALQASPTGMMLSAAWQATSGAVTASWATSSAAGMAAVTVAVTAAQPAPAGPSQGWPDVRLEAAFGAGITTPWDELTWTDLTARYRGMSGTRGKQYELDSVQAASMPFTLSNNDGALTPGNTSSAYYLGLSDWTAQNNAGIALSRDQAQSGPVSMLMAPDGVTASPGVITGQYAVPASVAGWSGQAAVICPQGWAPGAQVALNWYNSGHSFISAITGTAVALTAGQWAYLTVTAGTPPVGAAFVALVVQASGTPPSATLFWLDSCYLTSPAGAVVNANPVFSSGADVYTPLRRTETWQGRAYVTWRGFMERWPQALTSARYTQAAGTATDIYAGLTALLPTAAQGEVLNDEPWGFWPCTDAAGSPGAANLAPTGTGPLSVVTSKYGPGPSGAQAFGGATPFTGAASGCWTQSGLNSGSTDIQHGYCLQLQVTGSAPSITDGLTIEAWHEFTGAQPNGRLVIWALQGSAGTIAMLWGDYDGSASGVGWYLTVYDKATRAATDYRVFAFGILTLAWAHFAVTLTPVAWTVTIDGGAFGPTVASGACNLVPSWQWVTFGGSADRVSTGGSSNISLAGLALYPRVLPDPRILAHWSAANGALGGDGEGSRMTRLMSYPGMLVPRRLGLGPDVIGPATDISGQSCAQAVTNIAQSGAGLLFADRCGYLAYTSRDLRWNKAVQWSIGEQAGALLNANWDFESGVSPWAGHNGAGGSAGVAISASSAFAWAGTQSMLMIPDGVTAGVGAISEKCPIPASATVTGSARLYCPAGYATGATAAINWYDASGAFISATTGSVVALPAAGWAAVTVSGTAPGGARQAALVVSFAGTPAASASAYCDMAVLSQSGEVPYLGDIAFDFDPAQVYDDVTVNQASGITVAVSSRTSIRQYGDLTLQETVYLSDPDVTTDLANRILADYGQPSIRVAAFTVDAAANPYAWQFVLSADVGTVVQLTRRLGGTFPVISLPFVIQSVSPSNAPGQYQVRYTATPYYLGALATNDSVRGLPNGSNSIAF
jgi:hypothetical protein